MAYKAVIIDDEPWTRRVIRALAHWEQLGIELAAEACDGAAGLELIAGTRPDIVLTDVKMPRMSGLELVGTLRERGDNTAVIIISGYDDYDFVRAALQYDVFDYLLKPIDEKELNERLSECVRRLACARSTGASALRGELPDKPWLNSFRQQQREIYAALCANNQKLLKSKFQQLKKLSADAQQSEQIYMYYALAGGLQKYLAEYGVSGEQAFGPHGLSYSFEHSAEHMLGYMCEMHLAAAEAVKRAVSRRGRIDIEAVKRYVLENYDKGVSLESASEVFFVSREYLSRCFKAETGQGFADYVCACRMQRAKQLILEYGVPLKQVGALLGYLDPAHFYKAFKKYYGITPGEMQNSSTIDNENGCQ